MAYSFKEYPALIYKKDDTFVANCIIKSVIGVGKSEFEAVKNLTKMIKDDTCEYDIRIKPIRSLGKFYG